MIIAADYIHRRTVNYFIFIPCHVYNIHTPIYIFANTNNYYLYIYVCSIRIQCAFSCSANRRSVILYNLIVTRSGASCATLLLSLLCRSPLPFFWTKSLGWNIVSLAPARGSLPILARCSFIVVYRFLPHSSCAGGLQHRNSAGCG